MKTAEFRAPSVAFQVEIGGGQHVVMVKSQSWIQLQILALRNLVTKGK